MLSTLIFAAILQSATLPDSIVWEPWSGTVNGRTLSGDLGRLRVPANRAAPSGSDIRLAFVRLKATTPTPGTPIVYLAGGPGNSGIDNLRMTSMQALFDSLRTSGDLILLDQRGTGRTTPSLACPPVLPPADLFRSEQQFRSSLASGMTQCATTLRVKGIHAADYTTEASAADIDDLRRALGAEKIRLVGFSYGTHLGQATIRQFGQHVERAVLAGVEGVDDSEKLPLVFDQNLYRLAASVRSNATLGALVPDLVAMYDSARARLRQAPARVSIPNPLVRGDSVPIVIGEFGFQHIVARDLGDSNDWPLLPGLIVRTAQGDYGLLTQFARRRWGPLPGMMWAAMDCASAGSAERVAEVKRQARLSRFGNAMNLTDEPWCGGLRPTALGPAFSGWF